MRICPECNSTKIKENGEIVCTGCGLVLRDRDIVAQRLSENIIPGTHGGEWVGDEPANPVREYTRWVHEQRRLAKSLGLTQVGGYLSHFCLVCGKASKKHSKLDLCPEHAKEWQKERIKRNVREWRAKNASK